MIRISEIKLALGKSESLLPKKAAKLLGIKEQEIQRWQIFKKSLDARKKDNIHYVYVIDVVVAEEEKILRKAKNKQISQTPDLSYVFPSGTCYIKKRPVVVGFGPAGMFAALLLAQMGLRPIVLERGGDVDSRQTAVQQFWKYGKLDTENNVQFGEGGAGTFSDGKLTTRIKDKRCRKVLEELVVAGAPQEILYDSKPHIGTDLLRDVVKNIRGKIQELGGEVRFFAKVTRIFSEQGAVTGVEINHSETLDCTDVVLALGHSARDTFEMLYQEGVAMEQKPFAVGVRIEHLQNTINQVQYGTAADKLPTADYRLTYTTQAGRGVYTFCMCPGGYVVAAASEQGRLAINGMSEHARNGVNANAAILVQVFPEDFADDHPLAGMMFQRELEQKAYEAGGGGYTAPIQTVGDFLYQKGNVLGSIQPSYCPKTVFADLQKIFPPFIIASLQEAIPQMGKRLKGFDADDAILTAVESRSSSPVRLLRGVDGQSQNLTGLYPTGEGAGYAGGSVSAAVDGIAAAEHIFLQHSIEQTE